MNFKSYIAVSNHYTVKVDLIKSNVKSILFENFWVFGRFVVRCCRAESIFERFLASCQQFLAARQESMLSLNAISAGPACLLRLSAKCC